MSDKVATKDDLKEMYNRIYPYLGGMPEMLANKFSKGDLYSTDEKMIGQWIDGKPLYEKVIYNTTLSSISNNAWTEYATLTDGKDLVSFRFSRALSDGTLQAMFNDIAGQIDNGKVNIISRTSSLTLDNSKSYAIVQYTKTTDTAISIGSDTDYSTTEKIVGTWIDGRPLYQQTVYVSALPNKTTINIAHNISNMDFGFLVVPSFGYSSSNHETFPLARCDDASINYQISVYVNRTNILIQGRSYDWSGAIGYLTIQYVKTTDIAS